MSMERHQTAYVKAVVGKFIARPERKLHLGCGGKFIAGFLHVDVMPLPHIDITALAEDLYFLPDDCVHLIYAAHILEHYNRKQYLEVLYEWYRVLAPGGVLRLAVPDFAACAKLYYEQGLKDGLTGLTGLIVGGQRNDYDYHKMVFDEPFLTARLKEVGFVEVRKWDWRLTEHAELDDYSQAYIPHLDKESGLLMSLNLEAVK